jgi:hypothetical protein
VQRKQSRAEEYRKEQSMGTRGRKSRGRRGWKRRAAEQQRKEEGRTCLPIMRSQSRVAVGDGVRVGRGAARGSRWTE